MKATTVIKKNMKLLARSKGSAMVVLLAPLLIVLVIGFSFNSGEVAKLNIGVFANEYTELTNRYIDNLNTTSNNIITYDTQENCINSIKEGLTLACIVFPDDFRIENDKQNEVLFYVDETRENLVHQLISSLSLNLNVESGEVSTELTNTLLNIMSKSGNNVDTSIAAIVALKAKTSAAKTTSNGSAETLTNLDVADIRVDITALANEVDDVGKGFKDVINDAENTIYSGNNVLGNYSGEGASELEYNLESLNDSLSNAASSNTVEDLVSDMNQAAAGIDLLRDKVKASRTAKETVLTDLDALSSDFDKIMNDLDLIKVKQERISTDIASFTITDAGSIVNPVTTKIEPVTTDSSRIIFAFPYLLMLIVLFVGVMLSGTIVFMEKDSRAFFRTFTTPIKGSYFAMMTYLSSILVILAQVLLVLVIVFFALNIPVFTNPGPTALVLFIGMTVFILLGMLLGYLFNTSEGITMSTIAIGAVLIFLSNLILPIETLSPIIQQIVKYNPYVIASETLRKTMLFDAQIPQIYPEILMLLGFSVLIFIVTMIIMRITSSKYLAKMHVTSFSKSDSKMPEEHQLVLKDYKITIKDLNELLEALKKLTDSEYNSLVKNRNIFADWLKKSIKAKMLAAHIRFKSRKKVIKIVDSYIKRSKNK